MIHSKRLEDLLKPHGFELVWKYFLTRQIHLAYCRPSIGDGVYEHLRVDAAGKEGEAVWCSAVVTPLRAHEFAFKPCPIADEVLTELAIPGSKTSFVEIKTDEMAKAWETRVAEIGPMRARTLAEKHAEAISRSTAQARDAAVEYVRLIREFSDETVFEYLAVQLDSGRAPEKGQADPFSGLMICQGDLRDAVECAALGIAMFGSQIDSDRDGFSTEESRRTTDFKLRVALIADLLRHGA